MPGVDVTMHGFKESNELAPAHTHTLPIILLSAPPRGTWSTPIIHRRELISVTTSDTPKIHKYDMDNDTYSEITLPVTSEKYGVNRIAYDRKNSLIYISFKWIYQIIK